MSRPSNVRLFNRFLFALGMLGMLVVVHLGIQQSRGFDQGCVGFLGPESGASAADCSAVLQSGAATFLGVSNTIWGFLFYLGVAALSAVVLLTRGAAREWAGKLRPVLIAVGLAYSAYLVYYQFFNIGQLCVLCLTSAGIVLLLAIIQGANLMQERQATSTPTSKRSEPAAAYMKEIKFIGALALAVIVLAGADVAYFNQLDSAPATASGNDTATQATATRTAENRPAAQCGFDESKPVVNNYAELIGLQDPFVGNPDADVTVIEFFDPNCPHCKTMHSIMKNVIAEYGDQARFFYKPVALWQYSINQIQALYAAAQENKFEEMLTMQFERQRQGGLSMRELRAIAEEIDMNPDQLEQRIERNIYRPNVDQQRQIAQSIGLTGVPTILVNGRFVGSASKTSDCIGQFIEESAS